MIHPIKPIAFLSALATVVVSQSPFIPSGISSSCSTFLTSFNEDTSLSACTAPLVAATKNYRPTSGSPAAPTSASITSSLNTICGAASDGCPDSLIRGKIADFYAACNDELTSNVNTDVIRNYDVLFSLIPFKQALCSKGDDGSYCVLSASSSTKRSTIAKRAEQQALYPNTDAFSSANIPFLFLTPDLPEDKLCTSCTRQVLTSYINFESTVPYAPGLASSPLLKGQPALYEATQNTCGASFLSNTVQAAGGLGGGILGSGSEKTAAVCGGIFAGAMGLSAALLL